MKKCNHCLELKPISEFFKDKNKEDGFGSSCKICRNNDYLKRKDRNPIHTYFIAKRSECKQKGFLFDLTEEYLMSIYTPYCPIFKTPMKIGTGGRGDGYNSHLDRIIPELGYVAGNVAWISGRANRIKYNATVNELRSIADWLERATTISKESTPK